MDDRLQNAIRRQDDGTVYCIWPLAHSHAAAQYFARPSTKSRSCPCSSCCRRGIVCELKLPSATSYQYWNCLATLHHSHPHGESYDEREVGRSTSKNWTRSFHDGNKLAIILEKEMEQGGSVEETRERRRKLVLRSLIR